MNKITDQVNNVTKNCDQSGPCATEMSKMKNAAAALKAKLEGVTAATQQATGKNPPPASTAGGAAAAGGQAGGNPAGPAGGAGAGAGAPAGGA